MHEPHRPDTAEGESAAQIAAEEAAAEEAAGRHATNLELYFDLVFVFAVSQLSKLIATDISGTGVLRSTLVAWIVWQLWSQFSWLGTSIDLDRDGPTRLAFISSVAPTLLLAISIPEAYTGHGERFGLAVLVGTAWVLALQGVGLWPDPTTRGPFVRYAAFAGIAPVLIAIGGFLEDGARVTMWVVAAVTGILGTFAVNRRRRGDEQSAWRVDPVHFAERHGLFVIIMLGEVLVAIGVAASGHGLSATVTGAVLAGAFVASVIWWCYFGFVSRFGEEGLHHGLGVDRARLARDFFTFGHFPIVVGVAFLASVVEHVVAEPGHHLGTDRLWLLGTAIAFTVGGLMFLQLRLRGRINLERPVAVAVTAVLLATAGPHVGGVVTLVLVGAVLTVMQVVTTVRLAASLRDGTE